MQPHIRNGLLFLVGCIGVGLALAFAFLPAASDPTPKIAYEKSSNPKAGGDGFAEAEGTKDDFGLSEAITPTSAEASHGSPLQLMVVTSDRQRLANGKELLAMTGRIVNPRNTVEIIPPIRAVLKDSATGEIVYQWTIDPPSASLAGGDAASFNSAEVDIPTGGDSLSLSFAGSASL